MNLRNDAFHISGKCGNGVLLGYGSRRRLAQQRQNHHTVDLRGFVGEQQISGSTTVMNRMLPAAAAVDDAAIAGPGRKQARGSRGRWGGRCW